MGCDLVRSFRATGNPQSINRPAAEVVDGILYDEASRVLLRETGQIRQGNEIWGPGRRGGLRFNREGDFVGFLEP